MPRLLSALPWFLTIVLYLPVFRELYMGRWAAIDYTHAYFILPVSLGLAWRKRREIVPAAGSASRSGLIFLVTGLFMFVFGYRQGYVVISTFSLIPVVSGMVIYLYGLPAARVLAFPILYLLLLVPVPSGILDGLTLPMRHGISVLTAGALDLLGYPVTRQGLLLNVGGHEVFMGPACSGFRSLVTMFALALVYVYLDRGRPAKKLVMVLSIVPFALIGNLARTTSLCLVAYYFGDAAARGFFHNFSGMVIFVVMILLLLAEERILERKR